MLTITDLLCDAADALENTYKGRDDVPSAAGPGCGATGAVGHIAAGKPVLEEPEPAAATVTRMSRKTRSLRKAA
jgi:hypothetical protein